MHCHCHRIERRTEFTVVNWYDSHVADGNFFVLEVGDGVSAFSFVPIDCQKSCHDMSTFKKTTSEWQAIIPERTLFVWGLHRVSSQIRLSYEKLT
jgi:hypothetical protein